MQTKTIAAGDITPLHGITDFAKLERIKRSLKQDGWIGRPVLVMETAEGKRGLSGSHRVEAAQQLGIEIPAVIITSEQLEAAGLDSDYLASTDDEDREYRIRRAGLSDGANLMAEENAEGR